MTHFFIAMAGLLVAPAFLVGVCASDHGRSFWRWFAVALVGPVVAPLALFALLRRDARRRPTLRLLRGGDAGDAAVDGDVPDRSDASDRTRPGRST